MVDKSKLFLLPTDRFDTHDRAELCATLEGRSLNLCCRFHFADVEVESDSLVIAN